MKYLAAIALSVSILAGQSTRPASRTVTAVRHWSLGDVTRVAIEVSGDFEFRTERLHNPERVYFDIPGSRPYINEKRFYSEQLDDKLVTRLRVAETNPGVTRVVLDLNGAVEATTSHLTNPNRLIIEIRIGAAPAIPTLAPPETAAPPAPAPDPLPKVALPSATAKPIKLPVTMAPPKPEPVKPEPVQVAEEPPAATASRSTPPATTIAETSKAARHTATGDTSLVRALGLKIQRVVIDAGHGGHDQGTQGPHGLLEKDLVLDVALRVGKMIEEKMGAEVIYTRSTDVFIPLEGRTALANERKADLFLSIHANSSPVARITGVETYYLNFTGSKESLDVASRENASSQKSVFELRDLLQKITLQDKAEESKEFAGRIQTSLYGFSARTFPGNKNRGVKKAPFVVLIGANMPSVLAEIGFVSNPKEEALLKKPDYRQKLADALFRGVSRYADGLSHFQVAKAGEN